MSNYSQTTGKDDEQDYLQEFTDLKDELAAVSESNSVAVDELIVLQSIYGDDSIRRWHGDTDGSSQAIAQGSRPNRYEVHTSLPDDAEISDSRLRILVTLPHSYPEKGPPQLQLLSKYIGAYSVDSSLFGAILRTYISQDGVQWSQHSEGVFDGIENVRERCRRWHGMHLSEDVANAMVRDDENERHHRASTPLADEEENRAERTVRSLTPTPAMPAGVEFAVSEPVTDRKSSFVGRACRITDPSQVPLILAHLMTDRRISRAAHPIINAWRCTVNGTLFQDNDDDGESAAGGRLAHLLQILSVDNVLVVVTRCFGGIHLGADRFKHINQAARNALELGGFLNPVIEEPRSSRLKKKH